MILGKCTVACAVFLVLCITTLDWNMGLNRFDEFDSSLMLLNLKATDEQHRHENSSPGTNDSVHEHWFEQFFRNPEALNPRARNIEKALGIDF